MKLSFILCCLLVLPCFSSETMRGEITGKLVNIRQSTSIKSKIVARLPRGTSVTIIKETAKWCEVQLDNGKRGFVSSKFVKKTSVASTQEPLESAESPSSEPEPALEPEKPSRTFTSERPKTPILETGEYKKSTNWWIKSSTQVILFEKESEFNPLDSAENYRLVRDQYQSFSLLINRKNGIHRHGLAAGTEIWSEDSTGYKPEVRASSLNYYWENYWRFNRFIAGRQNVYTGFHYYKLDGALSEFRLGESSSLTGFAGVRVDTSWGLDNSTNPSGYLQFKQKFGYRSSWFVGYERAILRNRVNANDLGIGTDFNAGKQFVIKSKSRLSWDKSAEFTESKNRIQYNLNPQHAFYGGYNYFNPVFRDTLQAYYFDIFDYNKTYLGWRWRPIKTRDIYISAEGSFLQINELLVFHGRMMLTTRFFDFMAIQRMGDMQDAAVISAQFKYPLHARFAVGTGMDYANMDLYYDGSKDFYSYYGLFRYQPFNPATLMVRIENRQSLFADRDLRILGNLTLSYSSQKGRYFVWETD